MNVGMSPVVLVLVATASVLSSLPSFAATLPNSGELSPAKAREPIAIDEHLGDWFRDHTRTDSPLDLRAAEFEQVLKGQDEITAAFLRLRYSSTTGKNEKNALETTKAVLALISERRDDAFTKHPLYPYLLQEVIESTKSSKDDTNNAYASLEVYGDRSCPRKDYLLKELNERTAKLDNVDILSRRLDRILAFSSPSFRKEALQVFLDTLPREKQEAFRDRLLPVVRDFTRLLEDNTWLLGQDQDTADMLGIKEPYKSFRAIQQDSTRQRCRTAKMTFIDVVKKYNKPEFFAGAEAAALKLETCFQRKGQSAREAYWQEMEKPLSFAYGFKGSELARRKLGLLRWSRDDFNMSRKAFSEIADEAAKAKEPEIEANALFTLARIEENQGRIPQALSSYKEFVSKFPDSEKFLDAEMAMVLLYNAQRDNASALANAKAMLDSQAKLAVDKRNTGAYSFALFWAARLHYSLGQKEQARDLWERVAQEYYSTFYGALGHYVLEKIDGKALVLSPSKTSGFDANLLYRKFSPLEQPTVYRADALLKLGLRDEALCEIAELDTTTNERLLVKTLFQYASGEWLASIKSFDALPRSFRNSLASGFERILFPRSYEQSIQDYSKRIGMDPDLIFAIIRQESVFNPRANSTAGARGLMQLMPGTARVEAKRLDSAYVDREGRNRIKKNMDSGDNSLFDAETNITLGIHHVHRLLKKYNNSVFVLTSYNANPRATERWIQNLPTEDFLSFIERIPYAETRQYVKLVLRNYFYYKRWYSGPSQKMEHLDEIARASMIVADKG